MPLLREVLAADGEAASWNADPLARLSDFLEPIAPERHRFFHQLIPEVTYEGLPYRRRAELHGRTAAAIERAAGDQADRYAELLSMHCFYGDRFDAAWRYARLAAQRATARYANAEAAESYRRALAAAAHIADADPLELAIVDEALGEIYMELWRDDRRRSDAAPRGAPRPRPADPSRSAPAQARRPARDRGALPGRIPVDR